MGCDIHLCVERWDDKEGWREVRPSDLRLPCPLCNGTRRFRWHSGETVDCFSCDKTDGFARDFYHERNYELFAMLAGVRNDFGLALIAGPRDAPADISETVLAQLNAWGEDAHSVSFLGLSELLAYDWSKTERVAGILSQEEYERWSAQPGYKTISPQSYAQGVYGAQVAVVSENEWPLLVRGGNLHCYVDCQWTQTRAQLAGRFYTQTLPLLQALGKPEDVRIVFWFDS